MNREAFIISVLISLLFLSCGDYKAAAQSGPHLPPLPCVIYNQAPTIFVGQVLSLKADNTKEADSMLVEMLVREAFAGSSQGTRVILSESAYSADYRGFAVGKSFLVYASKADPGAPIIVRPETKSIDKARAELLFLRGLEQEPPGGRIFGQASLVIKSSLYKDSTEPLEFARLIIRSDAEKRSFEVTSDEYGNYQVGGLSPGRYWVDVKGPDGATLATAAVQDALVNRGCAEANIDVRPMDNVKGKIVDPNGNAVGRVPLELVPFDYSKPSYDNYRHYEMATSNDDGSFEFINVAPGRYFLAVNFTTVPEFESPYPTSYFPGLLTRSKAQVIEISAGKVIDGLKFVLPPERLVEKKISGRVIFPDGRPSPDTTVYLKEDENQVCCVLKEVKTDSRGNFTLIGFATRKYRLWTFIDHKPFTNTTNFVGASPVFILDAATPAFQIMLKPTTKESLDAIDEIEILERRTPRRKS